MNQVTEVTGGFCEDSHGMQASDGKIKCLRKLQLALIEFQINNLQFLKICEDAV